MYKNRQGHLVPSIRLTLQAASKIAADDTFSIFNFYLPKKIRLDVLCDSSAKQRIHMKYQALFYQKNNEKIVKNVVCCSRDGALRINRRFSKQCISRSGAAKRFIRSRSTRITISVRNLRKTQSHTKTTLNWKLARKQGWTCLLGISLLVLRARCGFRLY